MLSLTMELPALAHQDAALWARVLPRFQTEAGKLIVESVREELGQDSTYTLTETYSKRKIAGKTRPKMKRYANMSADEPLVLSGALYEAITAHAEGDLLVVQVADGEALAKDGDDYAEEWEKVTRFLEKGFEKVEGLLADLLLTIIFEEMRL